MDSTSVTLQPEFNHGDPDPVFDTSLQGWMVGLGPPQTKALTLATPEAEATLARWTKVATSTTNRLLRRQQKVVTEKLSGAKARKGTRWYTAPEGKSAKVTRELSIDDVWDDQRWASEFAEEFAEVAAEVVAEVSPEVAAELDVKIDEEKLRATTDAAVWASEFQKLIDGGVEIDEGLMLGWFANAIQTALDQTKSAVQAALESEADDFAQVVAGVQFAFTEVKAAEFGGRFATEAVRHAIDLAVKHGDKGEPGYQLLHPRSRTRLYHRASPENREAIRTEGLVPSNPLGDQTSENYPTGVFLGNEDVAIPGFDLWEVDDDGSSQPDPISADRGHRYSPAVIPPARLRLVREAESVPLWRTKKPDWDPESHAEYMRLSDAGDDDAASAIFDRHAQQVREWKAAGRKALGRGDLTKDEANELGHYVSGDDWGPLPSRLFHVTTAASAVRKEGLKTRAELDQFSGKGLGGGDEDTISFTADEEVAHGIRRGILEMRRVARGEFTVADMVERASEGIGASRPFEADFVRYYNSKWNPGDPYPQILALAIEGKLETRWTSLHKSEADFRADKGDEWVGYGKPLVGGDGVLRYTLFARPISEEKRIEEAVDIYKWFTAIREHVGGPLDPLFFSSDWKHLAALDPAEIQILEVRPTPKGQGYQMGALGEWRTTTGEAVELVGTVKSLPTPADLLGFLTERRGDDLARRQGVASFIEAKHGNPADPLYRLRYHPGPGKIPPSPLPLEGSFTSPELTGPAEAAWNAVQADYPAIGGLVWKMRLGLPQWIIEYEVGGGTLAYTSPTTAAPGKKDRNGVTIAVGEHVHNPVYHQHSTIALDPSRAVEIAVLHELAHALDWARCKIGTPKWEECAKNRMIGVPVPLAAPAGLPQPTRYAGAARVEFLAEVFVVTRLFRDRFPAEDIAKWDAYIEEELGWLKEPQMEAKIAQLVADAESPLHPLTIACDFGASLNDAEFKHGDKGELGYELLHPGKKRVAKRRWPAHEDPYFRGIESEYWEYRDQGLSHVDAQAELWMPGKVGAYSRTDVLLVTKDHGPQGQVAYEPGKVDAELRQRTANLNRKRLASAAHLIVSEFEESFEMPSEDDLINSVVGIATSEARSGSLSIRVPAEVMDDVLSEGRFKSQFETGTSRGTFNTAMRARVENSQFNVPIEIPDEMRPIYAYLEVDPYVGAGLAKAYGNIEVVLKPEVRQRSTVTWGDSLSGGLIAVPLKKVDDGSVTDDEILAAINTLDDTIPYARDVVLSQNEEGWDDGGDGPSHWTEDDYLEAQIHGGLRVEDIEMILFPPGFDTEEQVEGEDKELLVVLEMANKAGIFVGTRDIE